MCDRPVLIVEDDPAIRAMLLDACEQEHLSAIAVENGVDALLAVSLHQPSVMLLDLNLPELDGKGVLRALREGQVDIPVLLMTSDSRGDVLGEEDGVIGHVPKPFDLDHLFLAIEMVTASPRHDAIA